MSTGSRLGPYEVQQLLGAGGMGEVYRARDTRLDRSVALKVLSSEISSDATARTRFEREARAIAALDHPHICGIFDVGEAGGTHFLVMPLLDGQTLAARLEKGPMPLDQALTTATQVADALDRAHRQGIVHRDLKPANVMLTKAGVKLLDFGLAKLRVNPGPISMSTMGAGATTSAGTAQGTILGTLHYMAPEQVEGREADARSDIWALGVVLYEMLTGERPFPGASAASVIGAIMKDTPPPLSARQPLASGALEDIVAGCLAKDAEERWQSAADVKRQLRFVATKAAASPPVSEPGARRRALLAAIALLLVAAGFGTAWTLRAGRTPANDAAVVRFQLTLPAGLSLVPEQPPAVSPDGRRLALVAVDRSTGRRQVYLRSLDSVAAQAVSGTMDAQYPFWSADGRQLAFFSRTRLMTVDLASGAVQDLAPVPNPGGPGVWTAGAISYPRSTGPVAQLATAGGSPSNAAPFDGSKETNQSLAGVLPDGRLLVSSQAGLSLVNRDSGDAQLLTGDITMPAALLDTGNAWLVAFIRNGRLMAQHLNRAGTALEGEPAVLSDEVSRLVTQSARPFSATSTVLAFVSRSDIQTRPTWVDRQGRQLGPVASITGQMRDIRLSRDREWLSVSRFTDASRFQLLLVNLRGDTVSQLARDLSFQQASWSADGRWIVGVGQQGAGGRAIFRIPADPPGPPELLLRASSGTPSNPELSPDGRYLCYSHTDNTGVFGVYLREVAESGDGKPIFADSAYDATCRISPDGRWFAYHSAESGTLNVYIRSFPDGVSKQRVSIDGGQRPVWRADGKELYFVAPDGGIVAATIATTPALTIGRRERLFTAPIDPSFGTPGAMLFDAAPDGERFAMLVPTSDLPQPITVVLNWQSLLRPALNP